MNKQKVNESINKKLHKELLRKMYEAKSDGYCYNLYSGGLSSEFENINVSEDDLYGECHYLQKIELAKWHNKNAIELTLKGIDVVEKYDYKIDAFLKAQKKIDSAKNKLPTWQITGIIIGIFVSIGSFSIAVFSFCKNDAKTEKLKYDLEKRMDDLENKINQDTIKK